MAEFEELRVSIKLADDASVKLDALKRTFREAGDGGAKLAELGKKIGTVEEQFKKLLEHVAKGGAGPQVLLDFAKGFGPIGLAIGTVVGIVKTALGILHSSSNDLLAKEAAARRIGESLAQYQKNMETAQRGGIDPAAWKGQIEQFHNVLVQLRAGGPEADRIRKELFRGVTDPAAAARIEDFLTKIKSEADTEALNTLRDFMKRVESNYENAATDIERKRGPSEVLRGYTIFGIPSLPEVREAFTKVDETSKVNMEIALEHAREFTNLSVSIDQHLTHVMAALGTALMEGPLGPILKGIDALLAAEEHRLEHGKQRPALWRMIEMLPGNIIFRSLFPEVWEKISDVLTEESSKSPEADAKRKELEEYLKKYHSRPGVPGAAGGGAAGGGATEMQQLLGGTLDTTEEHVRYSKQLVYEYGRFARLLSGQEKPIPKQGPEFHNAPQGGAEGESNPMQLPAGISQPGGGAPAEARQIGQPTPGGQKDRPQYIQSTLSIGEKQYPFGSGLPSNPKYPSAPYGVYPIAEKALGPKIQKLGGLGINENQVFDPKLGRTREGIAIHPGRGDDLDRLFSLGCFAIPKSQWPEVKTALLDKMKREGPQLIDYGPTGARVVARSELEGRDEHNAPQGGVEGESNPMPLPSDSPHPGGGAEHEARQDAFRNQYLRGLSPEQYAEIAPDLGASASGAAPEALGTTKQWEDIIETARQPNKLVERLAVAGAAKLGGTSFSTLSPLAREQSAGDLSKEAKGKTLEELRQEATLGVVDPNRRLIGGPIGDIYEYTRNLLERNKGAQVAKPGGAEALRENLPAAPQPSERGFLSDLITKTLVSEGSITPKLNVSVNAPPGTDVAVNTPGENNKFQGNTSLDRQVPMQ